MRAQPVEERLAANTRRDKSGCWIWTGYTDYRGYGQIHYGGGINRPVLVHRVAWIAAHGEIPAKHLVKHTCGNRLCVNPDHLKLVETHASEARQSSSKSPGLRPRREVKQVCANGHVLFGKNVYFWIRYNKKGDPVGVSRGCVECHRTNSRNYERRQRAQKRRERLEAAA